jgi:hypothetical protein
VRPKAVNNEKKTIEMMIIKPLRSGFLRSIVVKKFSGVKMPYWQKLALAELTFSYMM